MGVGMRGIRGGIGVPGLVRAGMSGNEASAIGSLRAINSGEASFSSSCANGGYAVKLADLVKGPTSGGAGFISPDLKADPSTKSGYSVALLKDPGSSTKQIGTAGDTCNSSSSAAFSAYQATADPVTPGGTGTRYFATDTRGTIFQATASFGTSAIPSTATPVQ